VALHDVAAEAVAGGHRELEVDARADRGGRPEARAPQRLVHDVGVEGQLRLAGARLRPAGRRRLADGRQAAAVDGDGVAGPQVAGQRGPHAQPHAVLLVVDGHDRPEVLHDAGEHGLTTP
jgi:hypothetical protein